MPPVNLTGSFAIRAPARIYSYHYYEKLERQLGHVRNSSVWFRLQTSASADGTGHNCHCEFNLFYNPENQNEAKMLALAAKATAALMSVGAFFSRPYDTSSR
jgi:hypothetical protein